MVGTERFFANLQCALKECLRFCVFVLGNIQRREIVESKSGAWIVAAESLFSNFERALIKRFGLGVLAHIIIECRQCIETFRCLWIVRTEGGLSNFQHSLDRKSTRLNSSHQIISYAVFCLKKKNSIQYSIN